MDRSEALAQAAQARALKIRTQADRPSQRMAQRGDDAFRNSTPAIRSAITLGFGVADRSATSAEDPSVRSFEGFASVTGQTYQMYDMFGPYDELVSADAFDETLAADPDVPLVLDHVSSRRIARTGNAISPLILTAVKDADTTGLLVQAPKLQLSDPDTAYIVPKLDSKLTDEMSFRFMITQGRWNDEFTQYSITGVDIDRGDVSIVGYGANPHTQGAGLRAKSGPSAERVQALMAASKLGRLR